MEVSRWPWWCVVAYVERCRKVWRARWLLADGRHYGSRSGFATKWEAEHFADACEVAQREAASAPAYEPAVTVGAWWERWFPVQDLAPSTLEAYAQQYRCHIAPRFADVPIGQVTGLDLAGFARGPLAHVDPAERAGIRPRLERFAGRPLHHEAALQHPGDEVLVSDGVFGLGFAVTHPTGQVVRIRRRQRQ